MQPKRAIFNRSDLECGFPRHDFKLQGLQCSLYKCNKTTQLCVLYLHGYNGSRLEAVPYTVAILESAMDLCTFDFQAAGESEGDFVTFGLNEQLNVVLLVDFLLGKYSNIILWGRSMGATTALMYALKHQKTSCMILDSPFIALEEVILNLIKDKLGTPDLINMGLLEILKRQIQQLYKFSISSVKLPESLNINCPMLLLGSKFDTLIPYRHFTKTLESYHGQKQMIHLYNNHNEIRSQNIISTVIGFIQSTIQPINHNPINRFSGDMQSHQYIATGIKIKQKVMKNQSNANQNKNSAILQKHKALLQLSNID
ncbi:unnamed protein product (macronuclear) [Paramecium tetraurelia]|uniref:AB hydrolase-1 domain-containing protein n=1 Tax=Paramecium tetraurelia TaxID=5888 RepID=A0C8U7_PARTE|nr:uncharacterized protein GSPATT00036349001 [Paramecium tetraurelia]CAK67214.1 unnamed protein product [Paramecium tetraurelia]|eukprot:XP_001434611.1 hypothetical protein (macronuclear) [Paramecium tetraurelia strain d4-2]